MNEQSGADMNGQPGAGRNGHPAAEVKIRYEAPEVADYLRLRERAGMSPRSAEGAEIGLRNSIFAVSLYDEAGLAGMGRVVGDGGCFLQVVDIAVRPDLQGKGLGTRIMSEIMRFLEQQAQPQTYVSLIADVQQISCTGVSALNIPLLADLGCIGDNDNMEHGKACNGWSPPVRKGQRRCHRSDYNSH